MSEEKRRISEMSYWHELELILISAIKDIRYITEKHNAKLSDVLWDAAICMVFKSKYEEDKEEGRIKS